jgi:hypothetical protein
VKPAQVALVKNRKNLEKPLEAAVQVQVAPKNPGRVPEVKNWCRSH